MNETLTAPDPERVRALENARAAAYQAFKDAENALKAAKRELLEEQCRDLPRHAAGDVILVPKVYFGKTKMVEAKIIGVDLHCYSGTYRDGTPHESKYVFYAVFLRQKDGEFGGSSEGFEHREVLPLPAEEA
jgi:hypothetical protein